MNNGVFNKPKSIKERLSEYYLNLSENKLFQRIPAFKEINDYRERQKKDALEYLEQSKRPTGNDLKLISFYLYDIFLLEDFSELGKNLDDLFVPGQFSSTTESFQSMLEQAAIQPGTIYFSLPLIVGKNTDFIPANRKKLEDIPDFIKYIESKITKILPSLLIMTIHVVLKEELVNAEINNILEHAYQQRIIFNTYFPWKTICSGVAWYPPHHEKKRECAKLLNGYKLKTEQFLYKYFHGIFLSKDNKLNRCPSLEIYSISQLPAATDIIGWARTSQEFWRLLGFEYIHNKVWFKNENSIYYAGSISGHPYTNKLIIDKASIVQAADAGGRQSISKISSNTNEEFIAGMALIGLFAKLNEQIRNLKTTLFMSIKKRRRDSFKKLINIKNEVSQSAIKIDNVVKEYENIKKDDLRNGEVEFQGIADKKNLSQVFSENVDFLIKENKKIIEPINSYATEYFSNENIRSNYRLQKWIVFLTVIICILTMLSFWKSIWKILKCLIKAIF